MSETYGWSTHYSYFPGIEATEVDHLVVRPKTSWRGFRGATPSFGASINPDLPEEEVSSWAYAGQRLSELAWKRLDAGKAALAFARRAADQVDGAIARYNRAFGKAYFKIRAKVGSDIDTLRQWALRAADALDVELYIFLGPLGAVFVFYDDDGDGSDLEGLLTGKIDEKMGRLFRSQGHYRSQAAGPADAGLLVPRSGWSGLRGAKGPWSSTFVGPEAAPKSQYATYGADDGRSRMRWGSFEYEGPTAATVAIGFGALAVLYRAAGGKPLF